jgi:hypothetical protein
VTGFGSELPRRALFGALACLCVLGCEPSTKKSVEAARRHVAFLKKAAEGDLAEIRQGLPPGGKQLDLSVPTLLPLKDNAMNAREALEKARDKVQDLRVAKSTFFALVDLDGTVIRNDQDQDLMAGKNFFSSFPAAKQALSSGYVEGRGSMPEAAGIGGRPDAQWFAAVPVQAEGKAVGAYVTGWSWSKYAYRLETALRSNILSEIKPNEHQPLIYVYVVVERTAYGGPTAPDVNAKAIADRDPLSKIQGDAPYSEELEITGRPFGLAVISVPAFKQPVGIAVLRSET